MKPTPHLGNKSSWHSSERRAWRLPVIALSLGLLTACMAPSPYDESALDGVSEEPMEPNQSGATYTPQPSPEESFSSQFNFPLATCGDQTSEPSETWYSVFLDGGDINDIRTRYCGDALSTSRRSGTPTIQVASFTSYAKALTLAKAIGGVVEQTAAQATPDASSSDYQSADTTPSQAAPDAQPPAASQVGQSAFLSTSDASIPINIRQGASTDAEVESTGYSGERVQIANAAQGEDGYTWYEVRLESGTSGWVRGDLISAQAPTAEQPPAQSEPPRSQPPAAQSPSSPSQPPPATSPYAQPPYAQPPPYAQQPPYAQPPYTQQQPYAQSPYSPQQPYSPPYAQQPPYAQPPAPNSPNGLPHGAGRPSVLTAREPGAAINIREFASMNSRVRYHASPGDPVQVAGSAQGDDGFMWYQVRFESGAVGWVRSDLVANH